MNLEEFITLVKELNPQALENRTKEDITFHFLNDKLCVYCSNIVDRQRNHVYYQLNTFSPEIVKEFLNMKEMDLVMLFII